MIYETMDIVSKALAKLNFHELWIVNYGVHIL